MITTVHVLHVAMIHVATMHVSMWALRCSLVIAHIAQRSPQRLRRQQYKNGQKNVFHSTIIHLYGIYEVFL